MQVPQRTGNFHTAAYFASLGSVTDADVPVVSEDIIPTTNNHLFPSMKMNLYQAMFMSALGTRVNLSTPKLRSYGFSYVAPIVAAALPGNLPAFGDFWDNPLTLEKEEELAVRASTSGAGPSNSTAVVWIGQQIENAPQGDMFTVRGTSTTTAVVNSWTTLTSTFDVNLPQGLYALCGAVLESTNCQAFRLLFENQTWRPGGIGTASSAQNPWWKQRRGGLGVWGYFRTNSLPKVQALCNVADASFVWYWDVIRVAA